MRYTLLAMCALTAALLCACAPADNSNVAVGTNNNNSMTNANGQMNSMTQSTPMMSPAMTSAPAPRDFLMEAATGGLQEVELGRLAAQKGQSADVKQFGQRMVTDHSKVNMELKQLASSKGITVPTTVNSEQKDEKDRLSKLSGADFDREYMSMMVNDHDKDVGAFQSVAQNGTDAEVKAFAAKTLPTLQEHQRMAHQIKDKLK